MRSVFERYSELWPVKSRTSLQPLLSKIFVLNYPEDKTEILNQRDPSQIIVVIKEAPLKEILGLVALGYEHCLQADREDFPKELLAAALMMTRPESFSKNPVPFFFTGFVEPKESPVVERHLSLPFQKSTDKEYLLERLHVFLSQNERLQGLSDLCAQVADELISNALYSAPVNETGSRIYQNVDRRMEIAMPSDKKPTFFASFSDYRVVIGCEDLYGSLRKHALMEHLEGVFSENLSTAREKTAGAGLGFKYMIENAANFYMYCQQGKKSLMACGFLQKSMRANMSPQKHLHFSFK